MRLAGEAEARRAVEPAVARDHEALVPLVPRQQVQPVHPADERGGGEHVGPDQRRPDDGDRGDVVPRHAGRRVDDVRPAVGGARRRDGAAAHRDRADEAAGCVGVLDPDPPRSPVGGDARRDDVAAGVQVHVDVGQRAKPSKGPLGGPALDQAGRVVAMSAVRRRQARVERAAGAAAGLLAEPDHLVDQRARVGEGELAAVEPADLAVGAVRAEGRVERAEVGERGGHRDVDLGPRGARAAYVDADRQPHDLVHEGAPERSFRARIVGHEAASEVRPAWSSADCRDCA